MSEPVQFPAARTPDGRLIATLPPAEQEAALDAMAREAAQLMACEGYMLNEEEVGRVKRRLAERVLGRS